MHYTVLGDIAQRARLEFAPGEAVWLSRGALIALTPGIRWRPRVPGGVSGAVRRSFAGEGVSLTYAETDAEGQVALLGANHPGQIAAWSLDGQGAVVATRGAFLAAWGDELDITVKIARRAGAAFFGGAGLFLQRISGRGTVLLQGSGDFDSRTLAAGESLLVSTGNLAALAGSVDYDIQAVGSVGRALFGGEGVFMTRLTGPGTVLLQSLKRGVRARHTAG